MGLHDHDHPELSPPASLEDLCSWISDDLRYRDLSTSDYITVGKALTDLVLARPPEYFAHQPPV